MIDLDEYFRTAARGGYLGQLTPEFQQALRQHHSGLTPADCNFYHAMELPGGVLVQGEWDLRGHEALYLGGFDFNNKRVLEFGPASGHLTFTMEKSGATVVSFDLLFDAAPAIVPTPGVDPVKAAEAGREHMRRMRNSWWYSRFRYDSAAQAVYGDIHNIPSDLGRFDVAVFAAILLHLPDPFRALQQAAALVDDAMIVVEPMPVVSQPDLPALYFNPPAPMPVRVVFWWSISPAAVTRMLTTLGFPDVTITTHRPSRRSPSSNSLEGAEWFTIVGRRSAKRATRSNGNAGDMPESGLHSQST